MKILRVLVAVLLVATSQLAAAEANKSVRFEIAQMTCATCPIVVKKAMQGVDGVVDVSVNYEEKSAVVTFDPAVTTPDKIGKASTDVGFPATVKAKK